MARKIRMLEDKLGSHDHIETAVYHKGVVYEVGSNNPEELPEDALEGAQPVLHPMSETLANAFVAEGVAEEATIIKKTGPSETKG